MSAGPLAVRRDLLALVLDTLVPAGDGFPAALDCRPVTVEGYASGGRLRRQERVGGHEVDGLIADLLSDDEIDYVQLRNTEAGCYVARAVRA